MNIYKEHRYGYFKIPDSEIDDNPSDVMAIMAQVIILRAEHSYISQDIGYQAFSPHFDPVPLGELTPEYSFVISKNWMGKITNVEAVRVK